MLLSHKTALVTGSTRNIGLGIARAFAREGATVIVLTRVTSRTLRESPMTLAQSFSLLTFPMPFKLPQCSITSKSNINVWIFSLIVWRSHPKVGSWTFL